MPVGILYSATYQLGKVRPEKAFNISWDLFCRCRDLGISGKPFSSVFSLTFNNDLSVFIVI